MTNEDLTTKYMIKAYIVKSIIGTVIFLFGLVLIALFCLLDDAGASYVWGGIVFAFLGVFIIQVETSIQIKTSNKKGNLPERLDITNQVTSLKSGESFDFKAVLNGKEEKLFSFKRANDDLKSIAFSGFSGEEYFVSNSNNLKGVSVKIDKEGLYVVNP